MLPLAMFMARAINPEQNAPGRGPTRTQQPRASRRRWWRRRRAAEPTTSPKARPVGGSSPVVPGGAPGLIR
jgi:hypothetical protein